MRRGEQSETWEVRRRGAGRGPRSRTFARAGMAAALGAVVLLAGWTVTDSRPESASVHASGQDVEEAVMVAAGQWALDRLPSGATRLDPHRSGAGKDEARVRRVAQSLGATLATLDETRQCTNSIDPSTCQLSATRLLAIAAPRIDGDRAQVKVYAWYRSDSAGEPVAQRNWDLQLQRSGSDWRVVSGG